MSWMTDLLKTYDVIKNECLPLCHTERNSHIEIVLNDRGEFKRAIESDETVILPCTEFSEGRTSGVPHALMDNLKYLVPNTKHYDKFISNLIRWCDSDFVTDDVKLILVYLKSKAIVYDLTNADISFDNNKLIRWIIERKNEPQNKIWLDKEIQERWISYYQSTLISNNICDLTGEYTYCTNIFPMNVMHRGDRTKIISSNDDKGFTFRGWFDKDNLPFNLGYISAQKLFKTLTYLVKYQGYKFENNFIVAWTIDNQYNPLNLISNKLFLGVEFENPIYTAQEYAIALNKRLLGYRSKLLNSNEIIIIGSEAQSSQGRRAITLYEKYSEDDFLEKIERWYTSCWWKDEEGHIFTPSPTQIYNAAYNKNFKKSKTLKFNIFKKILQQCVLYNRPFPRSIYQRILNRINQPMGEDNWDNLLKTGCALINRKLTERNKEDIMTKRNTRSWKFGELLALADNVENWALNEKNIKRSTNAKKYWKTFSFKPATTWKVIYDKILIYFDGKRKSREIQINEILITFEPEEFNNQKLEPEFILAYALKRQELLTKKKKENIDGKD